MMRIAWPTRRLPVFLACWLLLSPLPVLGNKGNSTPPEDRLTPSLFTENRLPEQDKSGRTERLQRLILRHEQQHPEGWQEKVKELRSLSPLEQLRSVHAYINRRLAYVEHPNRWQPPKEAFASGGVCVEYATSKMLLLRDAGFPEASLRVVTLRPIRADGIYHVILLARLPDGAVYVLDSPDRAQSAEIVPLAAYRERIRPVVWAGWRGGFSSNDRLQAGGVDTLTALRGTRGAMRDRTALFASGDRLVDIAADLRVVRPGERPLTEAERRRLAQLRRYYHEPTAENGRLLSASEKQKLKGIRARLDRDEEIYFRPHAERKKFFFE
ncbi:MAG: transglutaminase-like cysteine peptidase [Magnetococcus sp. YQC-3]